MSRLNSRLRDKLFELHKNYESGDRGLWLHVGEEAEIIKKHYEKTHSSRYVTIDNINGKYYLKIHNRENTLF